MGKIKTYDKKGQEIVIKDSVDVQVYPGDTVAYIAPRYSSLNIGTIKKLNSKSITLTSGTVRYKDQFVKVIKYEEDGKV